MRRSCSPRSSATCCPTRSIQAVDGLGAFADGSQELENAFDSRASISTATHHDDRYLLHRHRRAVVTLDATHLVGRYDRTTVDNHDNITAAGEPGSLTAKHRFSRFNPAIGVTFNPATHSQATSATARAVAPSSIELGCADPENPC